MVLDASSAEGAESAPPIRATRPSEPLSALTSEWQCTPFLQWIEQCSSLAQRHRSGSSSMRTVATVPSVAGTFASRHSRRLS